MRRVLIALFRDVFGRDPALLFFGLLLFAPLFAALGIGCSSVRVLEDAGGADAPIVPSCVPYLNVIGAAQDGCPWESWACSSDVPSSAELDACRARVLALEREGAATCDAVRVEVEGCR